MKSKIFAILKFLTTFMLCFSLLSIHVEKTPQGNFEVEYSSVEAEEGGGGMMSMITMLVVGVVTWRLTDMCAKTAPDILIAAAAGALFIAGEATAILGHSEDSEKGASDYGAQAGGENEEAQTDAFKAQKGQAEDTKSTGETKLMLQAAAAVAFGIAAVTAFTSAALLETEVAACLGTTKTSIINNEIAAEASATLFKASTAAEGLLLKSVIDMGKAEAICASSSAACMGECAKLTVGYGACVAASVTPLNTAKSSLVSALNIETSAITPNASVIATSTEAVTAQHLATTSATTAETAIIAVEGALKATLPSKLIATTIQAEKTAYTTALATDETQLGTAGASLAIGLKSAAAAIPLSNRAATPLKTATTSAAIAVSACGASSSCVTSTTTANTSHTEALKSLYTVEAAAINANEMSRAAIASANAANAACATLTTTLEIQVAMCEPGMSSSFGHLSKPDSTETKVGCNMMSNEESKIDSFMASLISSSVTYDSIDKVALEKTRTADDPSDLLDKVISLALETLVPEANAGLMSMLGLAGPFVGIFAAMKTTTSFAWDNLLASPGNRAMIWTGLGVATAAATMQTNDQIAEKEEEIAELDGIIERMEGLDKDEQSKETEVPRNSQASKINAKVTGLGADFNVKGAGGKSVNDRLADIGPNKGNNSFSVDGFPCVKKDKNGECEKFAGSMSVTGNEALDKTAESIGSLSDSLSGSTNLNGNSKLLAGNIAKSKDAVDKALKKQIKKYNAIRRQQGKKPIDFGARGSELLSKLRGKVKKAFKEKGLSSASFSGAFNSDTAKAAREAMLKARKERLARLQALRYKSKGAGLNKAKRRGYGLKKLRSRSVASKKINPVSDNLKGGRDQVFDKSIEDIAEDSGVSIFGLISNRYNILKVDRRFGN